jgi:hypothetical protein
MAAAGSRSGGLVAARPARLLFVYLRPVPRFLVSLSALTALTALGGLLGGSLVDSAALPVCIFRAVTGLPCIFCGMSHAVVHAVRGDWSMAAQAHQAWWLVLPLFLLLTAGIISGRKRLTGPMIVLIVAGSVLRAWAW